MTLPDTFADFILCLSPSLTIKINREWAVKRRESNLISTHLKDYCLFTKR